MSYILDALKKSESERTSGAVPSLYSDRLTRPRSGRKSWHVVFLTVLLAAAVVLGWKFPWTRVSGSWGVNPEDTLTRGLKPSEPGSRYAAGVGADVDQPNRQYLEDTGTGASDPLAFNELDPMIKDRLAKLSINALSYSENQSKRFAMINQSIFKEGDQLGGGISLEEIRSSEVIFNIEGMRVLMRP